ncbi:hypothetical protein DEU38_12395 [Rhodococcus sp. AG1013]|uniref:hypothetical protein n=1 Tax=Rhodococcus sp. AG1013 TaxID=2183996 RepID=UPI000E0B7FF5|nr:hypothetical protein [Rhodococcus sp. AG1013]RDI17259.1 hypothetical protein DEU38_12395 [Rhodococcus sp. AG1013]
MSDGRELHGDTEPHDVRRWQWPLVVGCVAMVITLLRQVGTAFAVLMMLPDRGDGWRAAAREAVSPAVRNAGLLAGLLAAAAIVAFIAWLLVWGLREVVNGLRPHGGSSCDTADLDDTTP